MAHAARQCDVRPEGNRVAEAVPDQRARQAHRRGWLHSRCGRNRGERRVDRDRAHECAAAHTLDLAPFEQLIDLVLAQAGRARIIEVNAGASSIVATTPPSLAMTIQCYLYADRRAMRAQHPSTASRMSTVIGLTCSAETT